MSEIVIPRETKQAERQRLMARELSIDRIFVLLLGPSATGKSTIIGEMNQKTDRPFVYVNPYMTRPNRPNETDKTSVSETEFATMEAAGEFVVVNHLYGVSYGTPLRGILDPLETGANPILDYPLDKVAGLQRPEYDTVGIYVYPPSVEAWVNRVETSGRNMNGRVESGLTELGNLALSGYTHEYIDLSIINEDDAADIAAEQILEALHETINQ